MAHPLGPKKKAPGQPEESETKSPAATVIPEEVNPLPALPALPALPQVGKAGRVPPVRQSQQ